MIKGNVRIELKDENTGKVTVHEEHNMVTDALKYVIGQCISNGANPSEAVFPICTKALGGLWLFDDKLTEDASNIHMPMNAHLVGHAGQSLNTDDVMRGSLNSAESGPTDTGYVNVWDFSTSQAIGIIKALGLTSAKCGDYPLLFSDGYEKYWYEYAYNSRSSYKYGKTFLYDNKSQLAYDLYDCAVRSHLITSYNLGVKDIRMDRSSVLVKQLITDDTSDLYDYKYKDEYKWSIGNDGYLYAIKMNTYQERFWNSSLSKDEYRKRYGTSNTDGDAILYVRKFKTSDFTFAEDGEEQAITLTNVHAANYAKVSNGYYWIRSADGNSVYKVDMSNTANIVHYSSLGGNNPGDFEQMMNGGVINSHHLLIYPDGQYFKGNSYFNSYNNRYTSFGYQDDNLFSEWRVSDGYKAFPVNYLGTICNLSTPIVKTAANSMKVIYTLTDA